MATLEKIKPGQVLHSYHNYKSMAGVKSGHWLVTVIEVDHAGRRALCSNNGNPPMWYDEKRLKKLLVNPRGL